MPQVIPKNAASSVAKLTYEDASQHWRSGKPSWDSARSGIGSTRPPGDQAIEPAAPFAGLGEA